MAETEPAVPPPAGPGVPIPDPNLRKMTEHKAHGAAVGGAIGGAIAAPLGWAICDLIWGPHMPEIKAGLLFVLIGALGGGGGGWLGAYLAPRNRFYLHGKVS